MMKRGKGFSLVELMVALAAGGFLLAGVSLSYSA
ncbi:MAG: prepilin-type N-terminal cleavage/methylation domain-containing protein, partial [Pseudomonadota bacterium]|nr:prepilin-type N-terminal cleavage/methylation domain-containing protein [Pseudomonadota bacterium]